TTAKNLALAANPEQHKAVAEVFNELKEKERRLDFDLECLERTSRRPTDADVEVAAALATFDRMSEMAAGNDLQSISELFHGMNVRLFVAFGQRRLTKRVV